MGLFSGEARIDEVFPYPDGKPSDDCLKCKVGCVK